MIKPVGRILGFDARQTDEELARDPLPPDVRERLSLRPEVESPLSVDRHIWPGYFLYYPQAWDFEERSRSPLIDVDSDCDGGLWLDFARMKRRLSEHSQSAALVGVELFAPPETSVDEFPSSLIYSHPQPPTVPSGSVLLGYDVAGVGFWSGLSNCGYSEEEAKKLRPVWMSRINRFGLLQDREDAFEFATMSNRRVPEHAPFWVFGLHRINS